MSRFIGRKQELQRLSETLDKKSASFILIKGRRRIGKSRLVQEFAKKFNYYAQFTGLPPHAGSSPETQLEDFSRQFSQNFQTPKATYNSWSDIFLALAERVKNKKILLFFDEISWMGSTSPEFLSEIKNLWDLHLKNNNKLVFIICGSASAWIDKNILANTGFVGRVSFAITLRELPLKDCGKFWHENISAYEKLKVLNITGGIPKYLEEIRPKETAESNIERLCFQDGGLLVNEFEHIFSDIFLHESELYKNIIRVLANGAKAVTELLEQLKVKSRGKVNEYLWELELAGFIQRDFTWNVTSGTDSKLSKYRLTDNYLRFYVKYIEKNKNKIARQNFNFTQLEQLPNWQSIMGLQFENLVINNRLAIFNFLKIPTSQVVNSNPFFQRATQRQKGCQIDFLIQTKSQTLYLCEIKFSKYKIGCSVICEVQEKIARLNYPKGFSIRPVLIHVNGVTEELNDSDFFAHILDFTHLTKQA